MRYLFNKRTDEGTETIAEVVVSPGGAVIWSGEGRNRMRNLLADTTWRLLGDIPFDEANLNHWEKLPRLISGGRLWVNLAT